MRRTKGWYLGIVIALSLVFLGGVFSSPEAVEESQETIEIGEIQSYSLYMCKQAMIAHRAAVAQVNAQGGIRGRRVELISANDEESTARALSIARRFIPENLVSLWCIPISSSRRNGCQLS